MMRRIERKIPVDFWTSRLKLLISIPEIMETESPENVNHLHGNWRFENSGTYLHINWDKGVVRNRLMKSNKIKKALPAFINFLLISKKENIKNAISNITIP